MSEATQQPKKSGMYTLCRRFAWVVLHTVCPTTFHHTERIRDLEGPAIIISNHKSMLDPAAVALPVKREITFLGKKELTNNKLLEKFFAAVHMIVVDRHNSDMRAMRACVGALRKGELLGVFPEGTRHHTGLMDELESGVALMALQSRAPMYPVYITPRIAPFHRIHVYVGERIDFADLLEQGVNNETSKALLARITACYQDMARAAEKK